jgi:ATP-binding cassette, subfamily B, bacterial
LPAAWQRSCGRAGILILDSGRLVEEGTHKSLIAGNGLYGRLAKLQFETGAAELAGETAAAE